MGIRKKNTHLLSKNDGMSTKRIQSLNPFMPSGLFYLNSLDRSISNIRDVWLVFIIIMFCIHSCIMRSAASDLGLHCLQMFLL